MSDPDDTPRHAPDQMPQGRWRRGAPVARLTARTVGESVVAAMRRKTGDEQRAARYERTAERYAEVLGRSKGALMKAGQMVSFMSLGPAVPSEFQAAYQSALGRLRDDAPPMDGQLALDVLEAELGRSVDEMFAGFDPEPLAAASIGQVHRAQLRDGRAVAVKVQYPGVAAAIRADLKNSELLATFLHLLISMSPRRMRLDPRAMAREVGQHIEEELDYRLEAARQREFAALYRGHPFIHVPEVIDELSTDRVLTQELVDGSRWEAAVTADRDLRDRWAEAIFRFAYGSVNHFRVFNADAHPGNYLFHEDGTVSFVDFGCVKHVDDELREVTTTLLRHCLRGDVEGTWQACVRAGLFRDSDSVTPEEAFEYWHEPLRWYWDEQPFTVTPEYVDQVVERRNSPTGPSANALRHLRAAPGTTILGRMDTEVLSVMAGLRATNDWGSMVAEFYEQRPPVTEMGQAEQQFLAHHPVAITHA